MSICCNRLSRWFAIGIAIGVAISVSSKSRADTFEGMDVKVDGKGAPMIFIPGLNSASEVFTNACDAFRKNHTCYLVQLPGFAGQPPLLHPDNEFLNTMRDSIIHYIESNKLRHVVLVGHSLGGTLSLMVAIKAPQDVDKLVIVDALPFYPAAQNPSATVDMMRPQAQMMRDAMLKQSDEEFKSNAARSVNGMTNDSSRVPLLTRWTTGSDRATTTEAMYELMTTDLRAAVADIRQPILVLGAWAAYKQYGATKESTRVIFAAQYAQAKQVTIQMSEASYHFIPLDDTPWLVSQVQTFIKQ